MLMGFFFQKHFASFMFKICSDVQKYIKIVTISLGPVLCNKILWFPVDLLSEFETYRATLKPVMD